MLAFVLDSRQASSRKSTAGTMSTAMTIHSRSGQLEHLPEMRK